MGIVYLDHHSTTPLDPRVLEAMLPFLRDDFGNPSSGHAYGRAAAHAVASARERVAAGVRTHPDTVVFTSGATEANNLAIQSLARSAVSPGHVVTTAIEHPSVLEVLRALEREGWIVTVVPCDANGLVAAAAVADALSDKTLLVSMMAANNEVGTVQPIAEVGALCRERGVVFHCDAAQALGRIPVDVTAWAADLVTLSAHKAYGPKGVGALVVGPSARRRLRRGIAFGGGQERGLRPGTLNVAGIVGMAQTVDLAVEALDTHEPERIAALRDQLLAGLRDRVGGVQVNGALVPRLAGNLNVSLEGVAAEILLVTVGDRVALSSGSACAEGQGEGSPVLRAMGLSDQRVHCAVRFGLGRYNTRAEVDEALDVIAAAVPSIRGRSVGTRGVDGASA